MPELEAKDQIIGTVELLARDDNGPWAQALADGVAKDFTLEQLFEIVDEGFWEQLTTARGRHRRWQSDAVEPYEPVEIRLDVPDELRFLKHPLHVIWTVTQNGRTTEIADRGSRSSPTTSGPRVTPRSAPCWRGAIRR